MTRRGLTLMELLVALALGAVLLAAVQTLVVRAVRTHADWQRQAEPDAAARLLDNVLRADLSQRRETNDIQVRDGTLIVGTLHSLQKEPLAARHAVVVRYHAVDGALRRSERDLAEPKFDAGIAIRAAQKMQWEVFDGREWSARWPGSTPRAAQLLRLKFSDRENRSQVYTYSLAPARWKRHND